MRPLDESAPLAIRWYGSVTFASSSRPALVSSLSSSLRKQPLKQHDSSFRCLVADLLDPMRTVETEIARRPEAIHLYGVDLMSTKDVLKYFTEYGPHSVEWINDSSCAFRPAFGLDLEGLC